MSRRLIVRREAEADITDAAIWYDDREAGLGLQLTLEIRAAIRRAVENPFLHLLLRQRPEVRRILSRRFPIESFSSHETMPSLFSPSSTPRDTTANGSVGFESGRMFLNSPEHSVLPVAL